MFVFEEKGGSDTLLFIDCLFNHLLDFNNGQYIKLVSNLKEFIRQNDYDTEAIQYDIHNNNDQDNNCLLYTSPSPRDRG